jgi:hypothetical protein
VATYFLGDGGWGGEKGGRKTSCGPLSLCFLRRWLSFPPSSSSLIVGSREDGRVAPCRVGRKEGRARCMRWVRARSDWRGGREDEECPRRSIGDEDGFILAATLVRIHPDRRQR